MLQNLPIILFPNSPKVSLLSSAMPIILNYAHEIFKVQSLLAVILHHSRDSIASAYVISATSVSE